MDGILSGDPKKNPYFYTWNRVRIRYCDGTGHQGYASDPVEFNGEKIYFRGENNTKGTLYQLVVTYVLGEATDMIVTGDSAGGLATYNWVNYIKTLLRPDAKIVAAPDSGLFLDYVNASTNRTDYRNSFINFMQLSNKEVDPIVSECVSDHKDEKWKCLFA